MCSVDIDMAVPLCGISCAVLVCSTLHLHNRSPGICGVSHGCECIAHAAQAHLAIKIKLMNFSKVTV